MKPSDLFASSQSDKQSDRSPRLLTKDAARTHIPVCFRSSTQAQSQGFPLSEGEKGLQYHLLWSEGDARLEGPFQTFPDLSFMASQDVRVVLRAGSPSGSGRSRWPSIAEGSCFQYELFIARTLRVFAAFSPMETGPGAQTAVLKGCSLAVMRPGLLQGEDAPTVASLLKKKRG